MQNGAAHLQVEVCGVKPCTQGDDLCPSGWVILSALLYKGLYELLEGCKAGVVACMAV